MAKEQKEKKAKAEKPLKKGFYLAGYIEQGGIRALPHNLKHDFKLNKIAYICLIFVLLYFIVLHYVPMVGILMAFQRFSPAKGFFRSKWIGLDNFITYFTGPYAFRTIKNTFMIGVLDLVINFPAPIIFALILNEIHQRAFKKTVQTISYMPHFISAVVACGLVASFCQAKGPISEIVARLQGLPSSTNLLNEKGAFWWIYVFMNMWQGIGYGSIIYLSSLTSIDPQLYEAASIDGAGKWRQMLHVTLPSLMPMISMMLILRMGALFNIGTDKILLLYSPATYEVSDVIGTYVYRIGMLEADYGLSTAVGLFNSVIGTILLMTTNRISKKLSGSGLF